MPAAGGSNVSAMAPDPDNTDLVGRLADERLLEPGSPFLPAGLGRAEVMPPPSRARSGLVAAGATMTGLTLIGGIALIVIAVVAALTSGAELLDAALAVIGLVLAGTHWGWVHLAEVSSRALESHEHREVEDRRRQWLAGIAPYAREEVSTEVEPDGAIAIVRVRFVPVPSRDGRFTFTRETVEREVHGADEPAATVSERAERLRREAALRTEQEFERFLAVADAYETARLAEEDERDRVATQRAASLALSERLNAHMTQPPLEE